MRHSYALWAIALLTLASPGYADLAPPSRAAETCTLEKQARAGEECHACRAYFGNNRHCAESLASFGFVQRCRTQAASVWSEIWCRSKSSAAPPVPASVIAQLADASGKPGISPSAAPPSSAATSADGARPAPAPSETPQPDTAPVAKSSASEAPLRSTAPVSSSAPSRKSSCSMGACEPQAWSLLVAGVGIAAARLRRRR